MMQPERCWRIRMHAFFTTVNVPLSGPQAAEALNEAFRNAVTELVPWAAGVVTAAPEEPETGSPTDTSPT